ncbi:unnamed protein product [Cochlearia groenlandica]
MRNDQLLGVNKIGKNIKKTSSSSSSSKPQVSSNNNRFRSIVGQLQSSPLQKSLLETPKINMPHVLPHPPPLAMSQQAHILAVRPPIRPYIRSLPRGSTIPMMGHGDQFRYNAAESPVSLHMPSYTQGSLVDSGHGGSQMHPSQGYQQLQPQPQVQCQAQQQPRLNGLARDTPILPTPRFKVPPQQIHSNSLPGTRFDGPGILPSPTSQSSTANRNFLAPRPPYPSAPPLTPRSYTFSSMSQPGILGPGTFPQLPPGSPR